LYNTFMQNGPTETCYGELQRIYYSLNASLFDGRLPGALLTLQREKKTMGYFSPARFVSVAGQKADEIALNPEYFAVRPLIELIQTICHEMAHQWQYHHGTPGRGKYHNGQWADKMQSIGLMPSSTGQPGGARTGDRMNDYPIPAGRFLVSASELAKQTPILTWFDRYVPRDAAAAAGTRSAQAMYNSTTEASVEDSVSQTLDTIAFGSAIEVIEKPNLGQLSKTLSRTKYICAGCATAVWAKPGLTNLGCTECGLAFKPAFAPAV
jgi:hypothetical protein